MSVLEIINLPQVGESIVEGTIAKWLKHPGDTIKQYEPLVEVVTDKVSMEVPSPIEGTISKFLAEEGETVAVGSPILEIDVQNSSTSTNDDNNDSKASRTGFLVDNITQVGPTGGTPFNNETTPSHAPSETIHPRISPAVRKLAEELSINLEQVKGTGINGRITKNDELDFNKPSFNPAPSANNTSPIRKIIANNIIKSYSQIPHAWTMIEVDATDLVITRNQSKNQFLKQTGFNLTFMPFFMMAVITALKNNMTFNAEWENNDIKQHNDVNLGIAVASSLGLVVPVIHKSDTLNFTQLATQANSLITKANSGSLELNEVQNGTFTVNNTGALGSVLSKPIINQNQSGIITMESISRKPCVVGDGISIRSIMNVCLSFDHRLNDGYEASNLLKTVKDYLESISSTFNL